MAKDKTAYKCDNCNYNSAKWLGKCPECGKWNSFQEEIIYGNEESKKNDISTGSTLESQTFSQILASNKNQKNRSWSFSTSILNNFFGSNGLVSSSLTLMAGEPGIGKSTFGLQILRSLYNGSKDKPELLYITAEESASELALRSKRLDIPGAIKCVQANNFEKIEKIIKKEKPDIVIIDSIQTIFSSKINSNPGSVSQVSSLTNQFLAIGKSHQIAIILIGHVTKEGQIAGPKTLEHMVDSVLIIENSQDTRFRTLSFSKHRFGNTDNLLLLKMEEKGLTIITDPSLVLLENIESGIGICYGVAVTKNLPLMVEIQALVNTKFAKQTEGGEIKASFGRRECIGIKQSKLNIILAIMEKYLGINLKDKDIYLQINGLPKNTSDDSLDLPIFIAILSSMINKEVGDINLTDALKGIGFDKSFFSSTKSKDNRYSFAGRLTLSGKLRKATDNEIREKTAKNLGFKFN